ncbi:hypothetical protein GC176_21780 [bacterium]|nr:hypothetical protein [bacterium]
MNDRLLSSASPRLTPAEWLLIALGSALLLTQTINATALSSANDRSRWSTVWSLVERGTYQIDEIDARPGWTTIDKVRHNDHFYSSKPPLLSTAVAGAYWCVKRAFGYDLLSQTQYTTRLLLLIVNWLPLSIAFVVLSRAIAVSSHCIPARLIAVAAFCFGTLVTGYSVTLNNHSVAAVCAAFALPPLLRIVNDESRRGTDFALTGFFAALLSCHELPAALLGVVAFLLLCRKSIRQTSVWFVPAALAPLIAFFATNWMATGGWKPFYMYYGTEKYLYTVDGIPSYWHDPKGMDQNLDSPLTYFLHCTVGHHGIFSLSPIFLVTLLSWLRPAWSRRTRLWPAVALGAVLTTTVLGFYLTRTENYNYGGNTFGLRWMIWLTPFWILGLLPALERLTARKSGFVMSLLLLSVSSFSSFNAARNPWGPSWLFDQMQAAGWIDYSDPRPTFPDSPDFPQQLWTWFPHLPESDGEWIEFTSTGSAGSLSEKNPDTLRLTSRRRKLVDGRETALVEFVWNGGEPSSTHRDAWRATVRIDVEKFYAGEVLTKQIVEAGSDTLSRAAIIRLLRGIPVAREYRPGVIRYVRSKLRHDAFRCQRSAAQVLAKAPETGRQIVYRTDLWLCPHVPFGTLQFELAETDHRTGGLLTRHRFEATAISHPTTAPASKDSP